TRVITYVATDECGNVSDPFVVTITVNDDVAPVLECPLPDEGSDSIFLGCNPESSNGIPNAIITSVDYTDNCDDSGTTTTYDDGDGVTFDDELCEYSLTRTFSATDECGNEGMCSVTYTWKIPETETAFGFLNDDEDDSMADDESLCFIDDESENFNRWGWTTEVDFSEQSSYEFDIYQGAGQCDLFRGTDVGSVNVVYNGDSVTFTYNLVGYALSEAHIYIGCEPYPIKRNGSSTVAPGQYTYVDSGFGYVENYSVTIPVDGTQFNVIIHGVTSESQCSCLTDTSVDNPMSGNYAGGTVEGCDNFASDSDDASRTLDFSVTPVPFKDNVTVSYQFDYQTDVKIDIFDMKGALVTSVKDVRYKAGSKGRYTIDTSRLQQSMYIVNVSTDKDTMMKKIVSGN
ncbi:T9SS type A sorting domain-containing protein, partial [Winogradskyella sp. A3E31]|uniref:T9SS type A sorting domain-containing protein n=1 Tax=Winogradskyella sp. A3E31 TaxID=3349637 RepID=UPI00398BB2EE